MRWREIKHKKHITTPTPTAKVRYAGFWSRTLAFITDIFMIGIPITLIIMAVFGYDQTQSAGFSDALLQTPKAQEQAPDPLASLVQFTLFITAYVLFWKIAGQTPGMKMARIEIVDAGSFAKASVVQLVVRFFSYFIALFLFGYLWGLMRKDKRMLQDLISHTAMIYKPL